MQSVCFCLSDSINLWPKTGRCVNIEGRDYCKNNLVLLDTDRGNKKADTCKGRMQVLDEERITTVVKITHQHLTITLMYQSNRSLNIPPGHTPGI